MQQLQVHIHVLRNVCHVDFPANLSTRLIYRNSMIPRIEIGSMFPCLRISFSVCTLLSTLVTLIVCDCRTNFIPSPFTDWHWLIVLKKTTSRADVFIVADKAKSLSIQNASYRLIRLIYMIDPPKNWNIYQKLFCYENLRIRSSVGSITRAYIGWIRGSITSSVLETL